MILQLFLVIQVLLFWLKNFTVYSSSSSSSTSCVTHCSPCFLYDHVHRALIPPRGGHTISDNDTQESQEATTTTNSSSSNETDSTEDSDGDGSNQDAPKEVSKSSHKKLSSTTSPFRLLHEVRHEVLEHIHENKEPSNESEPLSSSTAESTSSSSQSTRTTTTTRSMVGGGGATAVARDHTTTLQGAPIAGVDTNRVAPLSLRLLQESAEPEDLDLPMDKDATQEADDTKSQVAKLWWVNVWTQQLSDVDKIEVKEDGESDEETTSSSDIIEDEEEKTDEIAPSLPTDQSDAVEFVKVDIEDDENRTMEEVQALVETSPSYVSSGLWVPVDNLLTLGLASRVPSLRLSRPLRGVRKLTARATGLHGLFSGKPSRAATAQKLQQGPIEDSQILVPDNQGQDSDELLESDEPPLRRRFGFGRRVYTPSEKETMEDLLVAEQKRLEEEREEQRKKEQEAKDEQRRMNRVKEIDKLIAEGQLRLQNLICEKDVLQRRLNPLFNYTIEKIEVADEDSTGLGENESQFTTHIEASRKFKFPPDDLVEEYLDMAFSSRRIAKMNHTYLWQDTEMESDDEESIGDDLLTPSVDAHKLYQDFDSRDKGVNNDKQTRGRNGGGGSWLLRQTLGKGPSIGEKIGEVAETAAYKAVCASVMSFLARAISSLHGVNVMKHSDIRLVLEQAPDLPRVGEGIIPGSSSDYAQEAIKTVIRRKARKSKKRSKYASEESFVQRDAVTEMLLSHVQISAPLLKLFPIAWQRAFLGNIITLATAIMADFFEGLQFQILGHSLSFAFTPITQEDMINHLGLSGGGFNRRRAKAEEFEAAVRATAEDIGDELKFLDRWHERALGSGVLRTQIANLIARIVLTLTDEVLSGAKMDLWSAQAGGPRMLAGLEYRAT